MRPHLVAVRNRQFPIGQIPNEAEVESACTSVLHQILRSRTYTRRAVDVDDVKDKL